MRWIRVALVCLSAVGLPVTVVWAGQLSGATIYGQVVDESGAVLPGVTVTVSSPALQVKQIVEVTDTRGQYRVTPLPLGTYTAEYTMSGFQTLRREDLRLTAGFEAKIDVVLKIGGVAESIIVSGASPVVDVSTTTPSTTLTSEILESVPTGRFGLAGLLTMAPGTHTNLDIGQFSFSETAYHAFGRDGNAWPVIEGVPVSSPFQGTGQGLANRLLYESTEEATVATVGTSAEAPNSGIQLNVITKSGGNAFHGDAAINEFQDWMQSNNVDAALVSQGIKVTQIQSRYLRSADLGGRIIRDKLWFFAAARKRADVTPVVGWLTNTGAQGYNTTDQPMWDVKLSYQLSPTQKLIGWNQWEYRQQDAASANKFAAFDSRGVHGNNTNTRKIEYQWAGGNKVLSLLTGYNGLSAGPYPSLSPNPGATDLVTKLITGAEAKAGQQNFYTRYDTHGTMTWYKPGLFHGDHNFKTGIDYTWGEGNNPVADRNSPVVSSAGGQVGNYRLIYKSGVPFEVSAEDGPTDPHNRIAYLGIFAQDNWTIGERLSLNLGLRYAHDRAYLPAQCHAASPAPFDTLYPQQCYPYFELTPWNPVVPRVHVSYDLTGNGKTVLKGGWGRFANMHGAEEVVVANQNADLLTTFKWHAPVGSTTFVPGQADLNVNDTDFVSQTLTTVPSLTGLINNPNLKEMGSNEYSVSLEHQLLANFGVRLSAVYSKNFNTYRVADPLRPFSSFNIPITSPDPGPDGKLGTPDDPGTTLTYFDFAPSLSGRAFQQAMLVNGASSEDATYKSFEIVADKRIARHWQLLVSYSATKQHIPVTPNIVDNMAVSAATQDPNAEINAANNTWEWQMRINASYLFPGAVQFSANFTNQNGAAWARQVLLAGGSQVPSLLVNAEPIGSERYPSLNLLTLRLEKQIRIRAGHRVAVGFQVYNALNTNTVMTASQQSGSTYGFATAVVNPRVGEFSLTYKF